ncbi:stonustoxin subunit alpha-like [Polymixia lowei]
MEHHFGAPIQGCEGDQPVPPSFPVSTPTTPPPEPKTRDDFLQYSCQLTLDPNTAYRELSLSEENRRVQLMELVQSYPEHPDRFTHLWQVLCKEGLSGRCYWEVEWKGSIEIAVAYKNIGRAEYYHECAFGCNDNSWSLDLNKNGNCFRHNDVETTVPDPQSSRVGVYLDHSAGIVAFYSVSDTMKLLHRVQTTFTQPLYPGLWVADWAKLCELK